MSHNNSTAKQRRKDRRAIAMGARDTGSASPRLVVTSSVACSTPKKGLDERVADDHTLDSPARGGTVGRVCGGLVNKALACLSVGTVIVWCLSFTGNGLFNFFSDSPAFQLWPFAICVCFCLVFGVFRLVPASKSFLRYGLAIAGVLVVCLVTSAFVKRRAASVPSRQGAWLPPELPLRCELVFVTFGGQTCGDTPARMHTNAGFRFGSNQPFRAYVRSNRFVVEAEFASDARGTHKVKIANGQVGSIPPSCDKNCNSNAFEIVDSLNKPILQLIYKTPEHVVINGLFEGGGVRTFAFEGTTRSFPQTQPFPRVPDRVAYFKYPSSKYQGVIAEQ